MTKTRLPAAAALFGWALWAGQPAMGQDPVDGVCDESVRNGCSAGTPNAAAYPDEPVVYQWRCDGLNGRAELEAVRPVVLRGRRVRRKRAQRLRGGQPERRRLPGQPDHVCMALRRPERRGELGEVPHPRGGRGGRRVRRHRAQRLLGGHGQRRRHPGQRHHLPVALRRPARRAELGQVPHPRGGRGGRRVRRHRPQRLLRRHRQRRRHPRQSAHISLALRRPARRRGLREVLHPRGRRARGWRVRRHRPQRLLRRRRQRRRHPRQSAHISLALRRPARRRGLREVLHPRGRRARGWRVRRHRPQRLLRRRRQRRRHPRQSAHISLALRWPARRRGLREVLHPRGGRSRGRRVRRHRPQRLLRRRRQRRRHPRQSAHISLALRWPARRRGLREVLHPRGGRSRGRRVRRHRPQRLLRRHRQRRRLRGQFDGVPLALRRPARRAELGQVLHPRPRCARGWRVRRERARRLLRRHRQRHRGRGHDQPLPVAL